MIVPGCLNCHWSSSSYRLMSQQISNSSRPRANLTHSAHITASWDEALVTPIWSSIMVLVHILAIRISWVSKYHTRKRWSTMERALCATRCHRQRICTFRVDGMLYACTRTFYRDWIDDSVAFFNKPAFWPSHSMPSIHRSTSRGNGSQKVRWRHSTDATVPTLAAKSQSRSNGYERPTALNYTWRIIARTRSWLTENRLVRRSMWSLDPIRHQSFIFGSLCAYKSAWFLQRFVLYWCEYVSIYIYIYIRYEWQKMQEGIPCSGHKHNETIIEWEFHRDIVRSMKHRWTRFDSRARTTGCWFVEPREPIVYHEPWKTTTTTTRLTKKWTENETRM